MACGRASARVILHSDMNSFYAGVEQAEHPELRGVPLVVGGNEKSRHGIVLAASYEAKHRGVKTAMTLWQARKACPDVVVVPPHYELYSRYSRLARQIYYQYTDLVEAFGLDECWLDLTKTLPLHGGDALLVAREISERIRSELGVSVSVGVSWNKIFAKFGSDHDKPDGLMAITHDNYQGIVWSAPVRDLLYVGPATERKLKLMGVYTIGQLARIDECLLRGRLGKMGQVLQAFARGHDASPVRSLTAEQWENERPIKSVGNAMTLPFDVADNETAQQVLWLLGESVAQRLRSHNLEARCVAVWARDGATLASRSAQTTLETPSCLTAEICTCAYDLLVSRWNVAAAPVRALGVRASLLSPLSPHVQLDIFGEQERRLKGEKLDRTIDELRRRFGNHAVRRLCELNDERLASLDPERDNVIHPVSYFA